MRSKSSNILFGLAVTFLVWTCASQIITGLGLSPYTDDRYHGGPQLIPGKLQAEYYDLGGEGVAYHDVDSVNSGSGALNPADGSYLHEFRRFEAVDISYTKVDDRQIDNNPFNLVQPEPNQLYLGWTEPGEWTKYSVDVKQSGTYKIGIMYTSNRGGSISLSTEDRALTGPMIIPSTFDAADSIQWRNWHHWNYADSIGAARLQSGKQVLTLVTETEGNMNYDYLVFRLIETK